jgi:hypothetical protein
MGTTWHIAGHSFHREVFLMVYVVNLIVSGGAPVSVPVPFRRKGHGALHRHVLSLSLYRICTTYIHSLISNIYIYYSSGYVLSAP